MNIFEKIEDIIQREGGRENAAHALGLCAATLSRVRNHDYAPGPKVKKAVSSYYRKKNANGAGTHEVRVSNKEFIKTLLPQWVVEPVNPAPTRTELELQQGVVVDFVFEKETPGTYRFKEVDAQGNLIKENYVVGTLYLQKSLFSGAPPKSVAAVIQVTF